MSASATRRIGPLLATVLVAGNMIGSGLFLLPASLATIGSSSVIGWIVSTAGALTIAGVFAVLGATRADPDGLVNWPTKGVHPAAGFVSWLAYWVSSWTGNIAIALAAVGYLTEFIPGLAGKGMTVAATLVLIWLSVVLCLFGARLVTRIGGLLLLVGLLPVAAATILGLSAFDHEVFSASWNVTGKPLIETLPASLSIILWAFLGLESANAAAAVVDRPERNVPIAALGGVALAGIVYIAASVAVMGVIPAAELAKSTAPFAEVVARLAGPWAGHFVALCAALKAMGTLGGWTLVTGEAGRSGAAAGYMPRFASEADPAKLPRRGLITAGVLMTGLTIATVSPTLNSQFNVLINVAVVLFMAVYALCSVALLRDPGQRPAAKVLAAVALTFSLIVIATSGLKSTWPALALLVLAVPVWWGLRLRKRERI